VVIRVEFATIAKSLSIGQWFAGERNVPQIPFQRPLGRQPAAFQRGLATPLTFRTDDGVRVWLEAGLIVNY
jgi:hypothetical protein